MKKNYLKNSYLLLVALCAFLNLEAQNNALSFNGIDNYVLVTNAIGLSGSAITIETWVYINGFQTTSPYISQLVGEEGSSDAAFLRLGDSGIPGGNQVQFVLEFSGTQVKLTSPTPLKTGFWYHIAGTYDGSYMRIYINGGEDAFVARTGSFTASTLLALGAKYTPAGSFSTAERFFNGRLDEVRIWTVARSEIDIRNNMYKELVGNETGLKTYYKLNETGLPFVFDATPGGVNRGDVNNMSNSNWAPSPAFAGPKNCLNFSLTNAYAGKGSSIVTTSMDNWTLMAWFNPSSLTTSTFNAVVYNGDDAGGYGFGLSGNQLTGLYGVAGWHNSLATISANRWYHVTMRRKNGTLQFFLDGKLLSYTSTAVPYTPYTGHFTIGNMFLNDHTSLRGDSFSGKIDEVRVYDTALTDAQIRESMNTSLDGNEANLLAYYNFDYTTGGGVKSFDGSGNANDLVAYAIFSTDWQSSTAFNTWLNTNSTDWGAASNWSLGTVPSSTDNVGIRSYSGGSNPTLSGSPTVNNLVLGNAAILTLGSDVTINGNFILDNNLSLNGKTITLGSAATLYEDNGLISGTTGNIQTTRDLNNISAENVAGLGATITTSSNMGSTTIIRSHSTSGNTLSRYYQINPTTNPTNATLIFNYDQSELNGQTEANLKLFKSTDKSNWVEQSSTVNTTDNTLTLTGINSFSWWTGANGGTTLSVENFNNLNFKIIPLYTKNRIQIIGDVGQHASINIYDILGKFIFTTNLEYFNNNKITIPKMAKGIYYVKVKTKNGGFNTKIAWF